MRLVSFLITFLFFSVNINSQESACFGAAKFAPEDGKKLLVIGQDLGAVGGLDFYTDGYVDNINTHVPAGVTTYTGLPGLGGLQAMDNWGSGDVNAQAYLDDETFDNSFIVIGLYISNSLSGIADGFFNNKIKELATWVKNTERLVFIRIGYEFEGPWNNHNPTHYKDAWRQIVHIFDDEEVMNAAYVWQSAGLNYSNINQWYPGDEYVNWVGYSHFDNPNPGQSIRDFAEEHNKPIMIAEATPRRDLKNGSGESHWLSWFYPMFQSVHANDQIKALAYINVNWDIQTMWQGQGWGDSRVQVNDYIKTAWINETNKDDWITASDTLFESLQLSGWLDCSAVATDETLLETEDLFDFIFDFNNLYISSKNGQLIDGIYISDFMGRTLYVNKNPNHSFNIPHSNFSNGTYVISIKSEGRLFHKKQIIIIR